MLENLKKYNSVIDYIRNLDSKNDPNSIALEYYGNKITRSQYWDYERKYRNYFKLIGLQKEEPVAICMLNSPEYEFVFSALLENGNIASTVSKSFLNADLNRQTTERNIKTLILSVEFLPELIKNKTFEQWNINNTYKNIERIIFTTSTDFTLEEKNVDLKKFRALIDSINLPSNIEIIYPGEMKKVIDSKHIDNLSTENLMDSIATYSNTGGTTGAPKCACHTHKAITSLLMSHDRDLFKEFNLKKESRSLLVIPISHITSQFYALLIRRAYGANIIYNPNVFDPKVLREILIKENIDDVVLPFGLYYAITRQPFEKNELNLKTPLCGGEPTPYMPTKDVNEKLQSTGSSRIIIGTGSTEFGSGIMASYGIEERNNESGYFFPYAKGFLLDPNTGEKITDFGKRGVLYANAPWQMEGYLNDSQATNEFFNYKDSDGVVYGTNNDVAEIVGEHNGEPVFSMMGRASDFILSTNKKTYFPGVEFKNGMVQKIDFEKGNFMFDLRDVLLNIEGVMEVQPIIVPINDVSKEGYPVVNITVHPLYSAEEILKQAYKQFYTNSNIIPQGIIFRTRFERSLSSDKREVLSLADERNGYYFVDEDEQLYSVEFPKNSDPIKTKISNKIEILEPPAPKLVYSNLKFKK